ncbi:MAG: hypothetical protein WB445_06280 [Acinetobacter sp.]
MIKKSSQLTPAELPEDLCYWFHPDLAQFEPDLNSEERGYSDQEWQDIQDKAGIEIKTECLDYSDIEEAVGHEVEDDWSGWKPTPPSPEYFLIAAFDTESGDVILWWAKSKTLLPVEVLQSLKEVS